MLYQEYYMIHPFPDFKQRLEQRTNKGTYDGKFITRDSKGKGKGQFDIPTFVSMYSYGYVYVDIITIVFKNSIVVANLLLSGVQKGNANICCIIIWCY